MPSGAVFATDSGAGVRIGVRGMQMAPLPGASTPSFAEYLYTLAPGASAGYAA